LKLLNSFKSASKQQSGFLDEVRRMKKNRIPFVFVVLLAGILLAGCTSLPVPYWPGVTTSSQNVAYVAEAGSLVAVDVTNGSQKCRFPAAIEAGQLLFSAPVVSDGILYVGGLNNTLHAIDANTCVEKWSFTEAKGKWVASPIVAGGTILAPNGDYNLYAIGTDGKLKWKFAANSALWATPVSDGKVVYFASNDRSLYAYRISDGTQVWKISLDAASLYFPILDKDVIYLSTIDNKVLAINTGDGSIKWTFPAKNNLYASPVLMGATLYIGDLGNKVYAISEADGTSQGEWDAPGPIVAPAAVTSKGLVFVSESGDVFGMTDKGEKYFNQKINGKLYSTPVVANDLVIVAGYQADNLLYAYDASGKLTWTLPVPK
jgi:outer membrane protein assembly factor BamB